jgi:hypothetical protein
VVGVVGVPLTLPIAVLGGTGRVVAVVEGAGWAAVVGVGVEQTAPWAAASVPRGPNQRRR